MGSEDEVERSIGRPCHWQVQTDIRTYLIHRPARDIFPPRVELEFPPISVDRAGRLDGSNLPGPAELGAVNPDAVHDHRQPACQCDNRSFHPAALGDLHRPSLEPGPSSRMDQHALGRFVEHRSHHLVSAPGYRAAVFDLARLILGAGQSKHRPD